MRRYWWTIWIKVAIIGIALFFAVSAARTYVVKLLDPYVLGEIEETEPTEPEEEEEKDLVQTIVGKLEHTLGVKLDYENMIFDYANEYAQTMIEESDDARNQISEPLSPTAAPETESGVAETEAETEAEEAPEE